MAACYTVIALIPSIVEILPLFIAIFGLSFFFVNFGPNTTTFLIPSEIYPTSIRAKSHGISAAIGKVGAFVGAFVGAIAGAFAWRLFAAFPRFLLMSSAFTSSESHRLW